MEKWHRFFTNRKKHVFLALPVPLIQKSQRALCERRTGKRNAFGEQNVPFTAHADLPEVCQNTTRTDPPIDFTAFSKRRGTVTVGAIDTKIKDSQPTFRRGTRIRFPFCAATIPYMCSRNRDIVFTSVTFATTPNWNHGSHIDTKYIFGQRNSLVKAWCHPCISPKIATRSKNSSKSAQHAKKHAFGTQTAKQPYMAARCHFHHRCATVSRTERRIALANSPTGTMFKIKKNTGTRFTRKTFRTVDRTTIGRLSRTSAL